MSASTRSAPRAAACCTASKITDEGSAPSAPRTIPAPARSAQVSSCSPAAARKVSPAASTTAAARLRSRGSASLPIVVVLPTPFTPTKSQTRRSLAVPEGQRVVVALEHGDEIGLEGLQEGLGVGGGDLAAAHLRSKVPEDPRRGRHAHVREDERLLELLEGGLVDRLAAADLDEIARQQATGAPEPLFQHRSRCSSTGAASSASAAGGAAGALVADMADTG